MESKKCANCHGATEQEFYCHGCSNYVCAKCDKRCPKNREHVLEDHLPGRKGSNKTARPARRTINLSQDLNIKLYGALKDALFSVRDIRYMYMGPWWEEGLRKQVGAVIGVLSGKESKWGGGDE